MMDKNFFSKFCSLAEPEGLIAISSFKSCEGYSVGKMLDFINFLITQKVARLDGKLIKVILKDKELAEFKFKNANTVIVRDKKEILSYSTKVTATSYEVLSYVQKNPICTLKNITEGTGRADVSMLLNILTRIELVQKIAEEYYPTLTEENFQELTKELIKLNVISALASELKPGAIMVDCTIAFDEFILSGPINVKCTPSYAIYSLYSACGDAQVKKAFISKGLYFVKYSEVLDKENSYFKLAKNGEELLLDFDKNIIDQIEPQVRSCMEEKKPLFFKVALVFKKSR